MTFVGFDRSLFRDVTRNDKTVIRTVPRKRELIRCKCSLRFEAGKYAQHVRNSKHSSHASEKSYMVDMNGQKHQPCYVR